jgi:hypothetical protein
MISTIVYPVLGLLTVVLLALLFGLIGVGLYMISRWAYRRAAARAAAPGVAPAPGAVVPPTRFNYWVVEPFQILGRGFMTILRILVRPLVMILILFAVWFVLSLQFPFYMASFEAKGGPLLKWEIVLLIALLAAASLLTGGWRRAGVFILTLVLLVVFIPPFFGAMYDMLPARAPRHYTSYSGGGGTNTVSKPKCGYSETVEVGAYYHPNAVGCFVNWNIASDSRTPCILIVLPNGTTRVVRRGQEIEYYGTPFTGWKPYNGQVAVITVTYTSNPS